MIHEDEDLWADERPCPQPKQLALPRTCIEVRAAAARAKQERDEEQSAHDAKRENEKAKWLKRELRRLGIDAEPGELVTPRFELGEGLFLGVDAEYGYDYVYLFGPCYGCQRPAHNRDPIHSLADLGAALQKIQEADFDDGGAFACGKCWKTAAGPRPEPTLPERLEALFREIVRDELRNREDY